MTELSPTECPSHLFKDSAIADISIRSADGKVFHLERKYLEINTGGFPSAEFSTQGELIHLTESSTVLEALFRFTYPIIQPDLEGASFEIIAAVAEAAEKYEVFSAMNFCRLRMRQFLPEHAFEILGYAAKHDYHNIIEEAVPHFVRLPLVEVFDQLPTCFFKPWAKYHEAWKAPFDNAFQFLALLGPSSPSGARSIPPLCQACGITLFTIVFELQTLRSLHELNWALAAPPERPRSCLPPRSCGYTILVKQIVTDIAIGIKNIPPFGAFLREN
ncbi:hypothetical protein BYT27DRAFT_7190542 [Phlegmacium glaucopus]|nr:hypothetical protein BYT27DRAFT_7190542 [Phlegmacium glaucopus]